MTEPTHDEVWARTIHAKLAKEIGNKTDDAHVFLLGVLL